MTSHRSQMAAARNKELRLKAQAQRARKRRIRVIVTLVVVLALIGGGFGLAAFLGGDEVPIAEPPVPTENRTFIAPAQAPDPAVAENRTWNTTIQTSMGDIELELFGDLAPQAVANFVTLAQVGFFDNTFCHRLTTFGIYVLQCGDPEGTGMGGPGYNFGPIENAPADDMYPAGTLAMARRGGDGESMGSQFFLVYEDSRIPSDAAGGYTVFGRITSGLDVLRAVADAGVEGGFQDGSPAIPVIIEGVTVQ